MFVLEFIVCTTFTHLTFCTPWVSKDNRMYGVREFNPVLNKRTHNFFQGFPELHIYKLM